MPRALLSLLLLLATFAQAQARPASAADAGVPRPDAGVIAEAPKPAPPPPPRLADPDVERLHRELADIKKLLERNAGQTEAISTALEKLSKQVTTLRSDFAEAEQRTAEAQRQAGERRAASAQAVASLAWAQQQLATGSTNVNDALRTAELAFSGSALKAVQMARVALANSDVAAARTWLAIAVLEAANPHD